MFGCFVYSVNMCMCVSVYVLIYVYLYFTEKPLKGCEINKYE